MLFLTPFVQGQDKDTISVSTEIVNVSVAVSDKNGNSVGNLSEADFELFDNGNKAEIAFFSSQNAPISYGIVYDLHPTTTEQTASVLRSLKAFTDGLGQNEDFFLTVFNEYGSLNINFVPSEDQIRRHLSFGERNEPNSLYDAVFYAGTKLRNRTNQKKTLIIISDGIDHQSHHNFKELERLFDSFSVQVYAVILDDTDVWDYEDLSLGEMPRRLTIDESALEKAAIRVLSDQSGGTASAPQTRNSVELFKIFERIYFEMRGRYSLGFYPATGGSHKVEVKATKDAGGKLNLSYRKTYKITPSQ